MNRVFIVLSFLEALLTFHLQGFKRVGPIIYPDAVGISAAAYAFFDMFAVPAPAFEHFVNIPYMCKEVGVVDLTQAHPVYVIGIFPVNPECWMLVQLCRRTGSDNSLKFG